MKRKRERERDVSGKMERGQIIVCIYCCFLDNYKLCFYLVHVKRPEKGFCVRACVCVSMRSVVSVSVCLGKG